MSKKERLPRGVTRKERLPRGVTRRGDSLVVSFALRDKRCIDQHGQHVPGCICHKITHRSLGPVGVAFAKEQLGIFKRQVREGTYDKKQARPTSYKVSDLFEPYMIDAGNRGIKDPDRWTLAWEKHLEPAFGGLGVEDVTTAKIEAYIQARREEVGPRPENDRRANGTINRELTLLRAMFRRGQRVTPPMVDRMPAFPARLKESDPREGFVTAEQYAVLARTAKELWLRALIACANAFGFRKGELLGMRVSQVDLLDKWLVLKVGTTKNDQGRRVKMTDEVFELMRACCRGKEANDYVFTRKDGSHVSDPRKAWYELTVRCGLGTLTPVKGEKYTWKKYVGLNLHDFRRSAIRNMTRGGVGQVVAMKISGHKTSSVFNRYNIVDEADLIRASELIGKSRENNVINAVNQRSRSATKTATSRVRASKRSANVQ